MKNNKKSSIFYICCFGILTNQAFGAGYSTDVYSASQIGNSYAGSVTGVHDVSDIFFNPSVTAGRDKNQLVASFSYLSLRITPSVTSPNNSNQSNNAGSNNFVPALYLTAPINNKTAFNLSINSPFGLATKYNKNWQGRYSAIESSVYTANINPSLSYKIAEDLSIGAGFVAQFYQANLNQAVNFGANDLKAELIGNDWGYGYNLGVNYKINDKLKIGAGYRSKIDYQLSGTTKIKDLNLYSKFTAKTSTPESFTTGFSYQLNQKVELVYDLTWTKWSRLQNLKVNADNPLMSSNVKFNWRDSSLNSVGANFSLENKNIIRTGLAFEKDAMTDNNRGPRIPSGNRIWASLGFSQQIKDSLAIDYSYCHQFHKKTKINRDLNSPTQYSAEYKTQSDALSIAIKKDF